MIVFAGIAFAVVVLVLIVSLLLRRQLREKYAILWIIIGVALLVLAVFPQLLLGLSDLLGVEVPSNLIFALSIVLLVGVALHLSWELSLAEDEVRRVAEEVAILRTDVDDLRRHHGVSTDWPTDAAISGEAPQRAPSDDTDPNGSE